MRSNANARMEAKPLAGHTIVVTRPSHVAQATIAALQSAGATVIAAPALRIEPLACTLDATAARRANAAVFVSANAVEHGLPRLRALGFLPDTACYAVGATTAHALREGGQTRIFTPETGFDSEQLLALPSLASIGGWCILLVKGTGATAGRTLIESTLAERGAEVVPVVCYQRLHVALEADIRDAIAAQLSSGRAPLVLVASIESFDAFRAAFASDNQLSHALFAVPHPRIAAALAGAGFVRTLIVELSPKALVRALQNERLRDLIHRPQN